MAIVNTAVLIAAISQITAYEKSKADLGTIDGVVWGRQNCKMTGGVEKVYVLEVVVAAVGVCIYVIIDTLILNVFVIETIAFQLFGAFACSRKKTLLIGIFYHAHGRPVIAHLRFLFPFRFVDTLIHTVAYQIVFVLLSVCNLGKFSYLASSPRQKDAALALACDTVCRQASQEREGMGGVWWVGG
jgi:hypothetical protein